MKYKLIWLAVLASIMIVPAVVVSCSSSDGTDGGTGADSGTTPDTGGGEDAGCTPKCDSAACGDSDGCGGKCNGTCEEGKTCNTTTYTCETTTGKTFTGTLAEFYTKQGVNGATVEVLDDSTGEPLNIKTKSAAEGGVDGKVTLTGIPESTTMIGIHATFKSGDYMDTTQYHFPADGKDQSLVIISNMTVTLLTASLGVTLDTTKGVAAGGAFWTGGTGKDPVGCATISSTPAGKDIFYMDDTGKPTKDRATLGTNPLNGLFVLTDIPVDSNIDISATVGTATEKSVIPKMGANSLAISNVIFDVAKYAANPTPTTCGGGADGGTGGDQ